jgi:hypothetical protein
MGCKIFAIGGAREALELSCDCPSHREGQGRAWFDCGTYETNLTLAFVTGWTQRRNDKGAWRCPQCARKDDGKLPGRVKSQIEAVGV